MSKSEKKSSPTRGFHQFEGRHLYRGTVGGCHSFVDKMSTQTQVLEDKLKDAYLQYILPELRPVAKDKCFDCLMEEPDMTKHEICHNLTNEELVDYCFNEALDRVNENAVIGTWFGMLKDLQPQPTYKDVSPYLDFDNRWGVWMCGDWRKDMTRRLLALMNT